MKLILNICDCGVVMRVKIHYCLVSCRGLIALLCLNFNYFIRSQPWINFMKLILNINDHSVVMYANFLKDVICYGVVIAL